MKWGERWLSIATALILVAWIQIARFAGREFERRSAETEAYERISSTTKTPPLEAALTRHPAV